MIAFGAKVCTTTDLTFAMWITAISLGAGSLLVSTLVKFTPPEVLDKLNFHLNEDGTDENKDYFTRLNDRLQGKMKRSQTEKLLESR